MLAKRPTSNVLADAAKYAKERLSRFAPTEEEIHRNLRGKVLQSGYLWERRFFTVTEHGLFVQESPKSAEMTPVEIDVGHAKVVFFCLYGFCGAEAASQVERLEGIAEWDHALRLHTPEVEFSLKADSEEEMFRWKNAIATLRIREESKVGEIDWIDCSQFALLLRSETGGAQGAGGGAGGQQGRWRLQA